MVWGGLRDTSDLISMVSFTFTMRRHLIRLASAPFTFSPAAKFGWVPFAVCNAWQRSRTENLRRMGENCGPILTRLWTKVHEIFRRYIDTRTFHCHCPIFYVTFRSENIRHWVSKSPKSLKNRTDVWSSLGPIFWGGTTLIFLRQDVSTIYSTAFCKVWLSSSCWCSSAKPGNEVECRIYGGWVKMHVLF